MIVAAQAGAALKKQVLELGGSDPFIVLADADIEATAAMAITARFTNAGQSCVNAKRFIVEEAIADRFAEAMRAGAETLHMGDPADPATTLGPLARAHLRAALHDPVEPRIAGGARLLAGAQPDHGPGYFSPPPLAHLSHPGLT